MSINSGNRITPNDAETPREKVPSPNDRIDTERQLLDDDVDIAGGKARIEVAKNERESFDAVPEELTEKVIKGHRYMTSKRHASCCSKFTYWYANNLVDAVSMNNGKMHESMIEAINSDSARDRRQLLHF